MAVTNPPGWLQNAGSTHTAAQLRQYLSGLVAGNYSSATGLRARGGVHPSLGDEFRTHQAASPNMTVLVEPGVACIPGTESGAQANYWACNDAQVTLSITAAHASLPRIDIVVVNVRDTFYSGGANDSQLQVITGTAASSPVAPAAPNNAIIICQVAVAAAVTSIVDANITDLRFYLAGTGGVINIRNLAAAPAAAEIAEGQLLYAMDTNFLYLWDNTVNNLIFPAGYTKIAESVLGSAQASVTFSSIPTTYRSLQLVVVCRSDTAATTVDLLMRFNSDSTANYDYQEDYGQQAGSTGLELLAQTSIPMHWMAGASSTANHPGSFIIDIPWYAGTTFLKIVNGLTSWSTGTATGQLITRNFTGRWRSTAAINAITLLPSAGNFITGSSFALYGLL